MDVSSENDTAEYKAPERLLKFLVKNAERHQYDFNDESASHLLQEVYMSLLNYDESNWKYLVKEGPVSVTSKFRLPEVQKRQFGDEITDLGSEVCGHVFRNGEPVYRCRTCAMDNTCVLCARCFRNTNHDGHETHVSIPTDSNGICDCGDPEAWKVPLGCSIHASKDDGPKAEDVLPRELQESIHSTISTVLDFILDVFNCSPINLKATQTVDSVLEDERRSRLSETKYFVEDEQCSVFRVMLWNDEKHKFDDVIRLTMEAMNTNDWSFGEQVAQRVNSIGRFAVSTSRSIDDLLDIAQVFAKVDLAVNVRSARDFFRENDCGTLILWLYDLMESQICGYKGFLRDIICDELVKCWNSGLKHPTYDEPNLTTPYRKRFRQMNDGLNVEDFRPVVLRNIRQLINERRRMHSALPTERITLPGDYWKSPREEGLKVLSMAESPYSRLRLDYFFLYDLKYWKNLRNLLSELYVVPLNQNLQFKRAMAIRFSILYKTLSRAFLFADREPEHSVTFLSVQFFTTPSLAELLVLRYDFLTTANSSLYSLFTCQKRSRSTETGGPSIEINQRALVSQRNAMLFGDLGYLLMHPSVMGLVHSDKRFIKQYSDLFHLFQGILCHVRAVHEHVEWDSSIYKLLFVIYSVAKLGHKVACCYSSAPYEDMLYACNYLIDFILQPVHQNKKETEPSACLPAADYNETTPLVEHKVSSDSVSFYHPLHWVLSGIMKFMNPSRLSTWDDRTKLALMDHPLRAFVWLAQIDVGLWVRNGAKVRGMAHHYKHLTIYDYAFDKDLLLVQLMVSTLPPDLALNAIVQRFELTDWVASVSYEHSVYDSERLPLMVEKLLLMIVGLITEREQLQQLSVEELIKNRIAQQLVFGPVGVFLTFATYFGAVH
ncbi:E3 ubiquitin-protein ligase ubr11 [Schizosaccharomyces japonicus yFS275]|uniref:E3 ubiquitin-protein ligase n=1 Tax=Schizosaccharomyces japonicus (strain yFS275 / FY16936) TaxID=402676 RepID=B6K7B1_SCHJY|nr:E3 ubiquitin-protein ligase ubr11 [Schizosaccharomyces japonicus yFS275]EEB09415.2 E3 ubiquitin-protein ligase ubr11 [Schizosaccharomyces japonicus yFS275]